MSKDESNRSQKPETNPTALGSVAEQSLKDAIVRGRRRRAHRANVSNAAIRISQSQTNPASLINSNDQIPYHKRRRASLIPTEEESEDSNDEWEEQVEIDPALAHAKTVENKRKLKHLNKRRRVRSSNENETRAGNSSNYHSKSSNDPSSSNVQPVDEKTQAMLKRRILAQFRKVRLNIHSIHACALISQLLRHDAIAERNEDVRAQALSITPVEMFKDEIPLKERVSIFALWARTAFEASVHSVQLNGQVSITPLVRPCSAVERAINVITSKHCVGNIFDVATVAAAIARSCKLRCRIVSALQLTPHQPPKPTQSVPTRSAKGEKRKKSQNKTKVLDFGAESVMYCWLEIWTEKKWRPVDIYDGSVCFGEAAEVVLRSAERIPEKSARKDLENRFELDKDGRTKSSKSSRSEKAKPRPNHSGAGKEKDEHALTLPYDSNRMRTLPSNFFAHVVAVEDGIVTDVSRRYSKSWSEIEKMRASGKIFANIVKTLGRELQGDNEKETDRLEQKQFDERAAFESVPRTMTAVQKHPIFVLERHIKKYEVIFPKEPVMGHINDEPVYLRANVHLLHTKDRWIRQMREVLGDAKPLKLVKSKNGTDATVDLYGEWQTKALVIPPVADDGKVPRGEHGNVDLWTEDHLPAGGVHINTSYAKMAARRLHIDFAPAMTGFELRRGRSVPRIEGIVIAKVHEDTVREAAQELESAALKRLEDKAKAEALQRWAKLLRTIKAAETVRRKYGGLMDGRSYESKQKREGARRAFREKFGLPVENNENEDKDDRKSKDRMQVEVSGPNHCVTYGHDYEEEIHLSGDQWMKKCKICGIEVTFEKI